MVISAMAFRVRQEAATQHGGGASGLDPGGLSPGRELKPGRYVGGAAPRMPPHRRPVVNPWARHGHSCQMVEIVEYYMTPYCDFVSTSSRRCSHAVQSDRERISLPAVPAVGPHLGPVYPRHSGCGGVGCRGGSMQLVSTRHRTDHQTDDAPFLVRKLQVGCGTLSYRQKAMCSTPYISHCSRCAVHSFQPFQPKLIVGEAILLHPLVCPS